jgi:hypothetical protein
MSGGRDRTALEETGARLGDVLRRALKDRLARRAGDRSTPEGAQAEMVSTRDATGLNDGRGGLR